MGRCSTATPSLWRSRSRRGTAPPRPRAMAGTGLAGTLTLVGALRPAAARRSVGALHAAALVRQRVCRRPARALTLGMPVGNSAFAAARPRVERGPDGDSPSTEGPSGRTPLAARDLLASAPDAPPGRGRQVRQTPHTHAELLPAAPGGCPTGCPMALWCMPGLSHALCAAVLRPERAAAEPRAQQVKVEVRRA
jgi:hypothetical protein